MIHVGAIVERAVRRSGISLAELARKIDVNRRTLYNWFSNDTLSLHSIQLISHTIAYDFSKDLPELCNNINRRPFIPITSDDFDQVILMKNKYLFLLEKYNDILVRRAATQEKELVA